MDTNTPPVCDYEGSDYQTSFWDQGGRGYEDAVEAVALKRLLPDKGKLMLELGAGAGRNTPRYAGYEKIVLLDYSLTQLEQAQQRLGRGRQYIYVAADVYRLPFVDGLFDGATMIRTLHHMADAPLALGQVERVMGSGGVFILEFASKLNLKAIARWLLGRQSWSPFTPEQVEFVPLNFDFHPKTVFQWLSQLGFNTEGILTVSHLRAGIFKKLLPTQWLVAMDSLFQLSGKWWQLTPSVFTKNRIIQQKPAAEGFFQCPSCSSNDLMEVGELIICQGCKQQYSSVNGIYDFRLK